jgi:hypothetical protein
MHSVPWTEVDLEAADSLRINLLENALRAADRTLRDREKTYQRQSLLLSALDHRVRAALGKIEAMVTKASTTSMSVQTFATALHHRIQAMTQTHILLAEGRRVGLADGCAGIEHGVARVAEQRAQAWPHDQRRSPRPRGFRIRARRTMLQLAAARRRLVASMMRSDRGADARKAGHPALLQRMWGGR